MELMDHNKSVAGVNMGHLWDEGDLLRGEMDALNEHYRHGEIEPNIDSTFTFDEVKEGHRRMQNRQNVGKILFVPE
jgi:NADPH:quinone reductase-like Zn-dependent oxidoreductase